MKTVKNIVLYGNCQIGNISRILKLLYKSELSVFNMEQVQKINDIGYYDEIIPNLKSADHIIMQNISLKEKDPFLKIIPFINENTKVIFIDSLYNISYHPELIKTTIIPTFKFGLLHDINILKACYNNFSIKEFIRNDPYYNVDFYSSQKYIELQESTLEELTLRESQLKNKISKCTHNNIKYINIIPYILSSYEATGKSHWADFNHPKLIVYKWLVKQIANEIELYFPDNIFDSIFNDQTFLNINYPLYYSTIDKLNIYCDINDKYSLGKHYMAKDREEYVIDAFRFYNSLNKVKIQKYLIKSGNIN